MKYQNALLTLLAVMSTHASHAAPFIYITGDADALCLDFIPGGTNISIIDAATNMCIARAKVNAGKQYQGISLSEDGKTVYGTTDGHPNEIIPNDWDIDIHEACSGFYDASFLQQALTAKPSCVNNKNDKNQTPLETLFKSYGKLPTKHQKASLLMNAGANITLSNKPYKTILDIIEEEAGDSWPRQTEQYRQIAATIIAAPQSKEAIARARALKEARSFKGKTLSILASICGKPKIQPT